MTTRDNLLHVYLRDHLAGATAGVALAGRLAKNQRASPIAAELAAFARDVEADRAALITLMDSVGAEHGRAKMLLGVLGERMSRVKFNGTLLTRSPLSTVFELEMMRMGVEGKASGWRTLRAIAETDRRLDASRLDELITRAEHQSAQLEQVRLQAAKAALLDA